MNKQGRKYAVTPTMFTDPFSAMKIIEPDSQLVATFHALLNTIENDNLALSIDMVVEHLLRFRDPNRRSSYCIEVTCIEVTKHD